MELTETFVGNDLNALDEELVQFKLFVENCQSDEAKQAREELANLLQKYFPGQSQVLFYDSNQADAEKVPMPVGKRPIIEFTCCGTSYTVLGGVDKVEQILEKVKMEDAFSSESTPSVTAS